MGRVEVRGGTGVGSEGGGGRSQAFCCPAEKTSVREDTAPLDGEGRARALHVAIAGADASCPKPIEHGDAQVSSVCLD